ncbi:MAG: MaoC family dehydratase [Pigmentiphaga sp.]
MTASGSGGETQLAAEDFQVGDHVLTRELILDAEKFRQFAKLTGDVHPIHYDAGYARQRGYEAPVAHGLLLTAVTALGATAMSSRLHQSMIALIDVQAEFIAAVVADTPLSLVFIVAGVEAKSRNRSVVEFMIELRSPGNWLHARVRHRYLLKTHLTKGTS